jgi:hypothetical protein
MKKYQVKIDVSGGCSIPLKEIAEGIADFLRKRKLFKTVDLKIAKEREIYDGFASEESVLISVK